MIELKERVIVMSKKLKAVLFDLDGVLFDTEYISAENVCSRAEAIGVHLASDNPATSFVDECAQDATVQGVYPSLIIGLWLPVGDNVVAVFPKL